MTDQLTLTKLQDWIPKFCEEDATIIRYEIDSMTLFLVIENPQARNDILENLLLVDCPIPTLDTLFDNIGFLEPLSWIMKGLLDEQRIPVSVTEKKKSQ
jgi:hypothetical protein